MFSLVYHHELLAPSEDLAERYGASRKHCHSLSQAWAERKCVWSERSVCGVCGAGTVISLSLSLSLSLSVSLSLSLCLSLSVTL